MTPAEEKREEITWDMLCDRMQQLKKLLPDVWHIAYSAMSYAYDLGDTTKKSLDRLLAAAEDVDLAWERVRASKKLEKALGELCDSVSELARGW